MPALPEWSDAAWMQARKFPSFADALGSVHRPQHPQDILPTQPARMRLAFDELLAHARIGRAVCDEMLHGRVGIFRFRRHAGFGQRLERRKRIARLNDRTLVFFEMRERCERQA